MEWKHFKKLRKWQHNTNTQANVGQMSIRISRLSFDVSSISFLGTQQFDQLAQLGLSSLFIASMILSHSPGFCQMIYNCQWYMRLERFRWTVQNPGVIPVRWLTARDFDNQTWQWTISDSWTYHFHSFSMTMLDFQRVITITPSLFNGLSMVVLCFPSLFASPRPCPLTSRSNPHSVRRRKTPARSARIWGKTQE